MNGPEASVMCVVIKIGFPLSNRPRRRLRETLVF